MMQIKQSTLKRYVVAGFSPRSGEFADVYIPACPERGLKPATTVQPSRYKVSNPDR